MTQLTGSNLFQSVYKATADGIAAKGHAAADPWGAIVPKLQKLCGTTFEMTQAGVLGEFRDAAKIRSKAAGSYGKFLAGASGIDTKPGATPPTEPQLARVAALELLFHTYHHYTKGGEAVWIVSVPTNYEAWPHVAMKSGSATKMLGLLDAGAAERFSPKNRKDIATAAQTGLAWVQKALVALDDLAATSTTMTLLRRWFGDATTTDPQLVTFAATLKAGLKKIAPKLNGGTAIITDFVPIRTSTVDKDIGARSSNAFVVAAEKQDVIYIENGFFTKNAGNVFQEDARHWARIMVHEMTHREAATVDKRYGWAGIVPATGKISSADAMVNADSWALFVADAAGVMTALDIARAT